jgi:heme/copper-type cytochrome/quinol oxidase subunit 2
MRGSVESASIAMPRRATEIVWTIVPAIGLAVLLFFTWRAIDSRSVAADPHAAHGGAPRG